MARAIAHKALARWNAHPRVADAYFEYDGWAADDGPAYWVALVPGWGVGGEAGLHTIHEPSVREVDAKLRDIEPCDCFNCQVQLNKQTQGA